MAAKKKQAGGGKEAVKPVMVRCSSEEEREAIRAARDASGAGDQWYRLVVLEAAGIDVLGAALKRARAAGEKVGDRG